MATTDSLIDSSNREMDLAWQFIANTGVSVFLTGKAGTGKTTFLRHLRTILPKRMVVLAPTGVAAINAGGQTIHSFFQFAPGPFIPGAISKEANNLFRMAKHKKNLIRSLDLLVIDEISMVRADLLDRIDDALRRYRDPSRPFGGVQLLLIGDLMQLSPVIKNDEWAMLSQYYPTPYFFSSNALASLHYVTIELRNIYRQQDPAFIDLLAKVRCGKVGYADLQLLNSRFIPNFSSDQPGWIRLTTHNLAAHSYNEARLARINSKQLNFPCSVTGDFPEQNYPAEPSLALKKGAQVMFIKNDVSAAHAYYNGKIGTVTGISSTAVEVTCPDSDDPIVVTPVTWDNTKYTLDPVSKEIKEEVVGSFTQYPLRLAWAITIHKSQGLTFDKAVLDINDAFAHGQSYVALSRCRSLHGMVLTAPVNAGALITDSTVNSFIDAETAKKDAIISSLPSLKQQYFFSLLDELYSFADIDRDYQWMLRVVDEHLSSQYPKFLIRLKAVQRPLQERLTDIAARFRPLYAAALQQSSSIIPDSPIEKRIADSCRYFAEAVKEIFESLITKDAIINIENKRVAEIYGNALSALRNSVLLKYALFSELAKKTFSTSAYLDIKARTAISLDENTTATKNKRRKANPRQTEKSADKAFGQSITMKSTPMASTAMRETAVENGAMGATATKKKASGKRSKGGTFKATLRLHESGLSPDQIAQKRNLKSSTIYDHLAQLVAQGLIDIDDLVSKEHRLIIRNAALQFTTAYTLKDIREIVPDDISYPEIKITINSLNR